MFERRLYVHMDWLLLGAVYLLCAIGVVMIYSASGARACISRNWRPSPSAPSRSWSASASTTGRSPIART